MYAVVYKNRVIVGPMDWNRGIFEGSLEKEGVKVGLPRVPPETLPYTVNEDSMITFVEENRPQLNPMVEYYYGPLWEITDTKVIANYEVHDSPVGSAKVNFRNQAAEERWKKEIAKIKINIQQTEVTVDTSREGRNMFVQKYAAMSDGDTVNWKFPEGWLTLTKVDMHEIVVAGDLHVQSCFDWEKSINEQIDAATTKEELIAIVIVEEKQQN